jgi:hypothetical protein
MNRTAVVMAGLILMVHPYSTSVRVGPPARSGHSLVYSTQLKAILMFGGAEEHDPDPTSLWAYDGVTWHKLADKGPSARDDAILVNDAARNRLVLYGGRQRRNGGMTVLTDTWEWDGTAWSLRDTVGPGPRVHAAAAYDVTRQRVVLYGGGALDDRVLSDTWEWDGQSWKQRGTSGPENRFVNGMSYNPRIGQVVLSTVQPDSTGCHMKAELWTWDGKSWGDVPSNGIVPAFSPRAPQAQSGGGDDTMLFDGWPCAPRTSATWTWHSPFWQRYAEGGPGPRKGTSVAYDESRKVTVLFGGEDDGQMYADTWEWDGQRWMKRNGGD